MLNKEYKKMLYETIMNNAKASKTGRMNAVIPVAMINADPLYQRVEGRNKSKQRKLKKEWDYNLMDALMVFAHPETYDFYVVDGLGRLIVAKEIGLEELDCVIIIGPTDVEERRRLEAMYFLRQAICTDPVKPVHQHNALVINNDPVAITIEEVCNKYSVRIMPDGRTKAKKKLGSYSSTYRMLKNDESRRENLEWVFNLIELAGFDQDLNGYSAGIVESLYVIHNGFPNVDARTIAQYLRTMNVVTFKARAISKYPERYGNGGKGSMILFLQDYIMETFSERAVFNKEGKKVIYMQTA